MDIGFWDVFAWSIAWVWGSAFAGGLGFIIFLLVGAIFGKLIE